MLKLNLPPPHQVSDFVSQVLLLLELVHPGDHLHHLFVLVLLAAAHALLLRG